MLTLEQLKFIKASLCAKGSVISTEDGGKTVRLFVMTIDEVNAQISEREQSLPSPAAKDVPA